MNRLKDLWNSRIIPDLIVLMLILTVGYLWISQSSIPAATSSFINGPPTPTATATSTPAPPAGRIHLKLSTADIAQLEGFGGMAPPTAGIPAQLIVVVKKTASAENETVITQHVSERYCVEVSAFLDKADVRLPGGYDKTNATSVLLTLQISDLARYGVAVPDKVQMYLVPDPACME